MAFKNDFFQRYLSEDNTSVLNANSRDKDWQKADQKIDVLVIGGGVTGCGVALDAASRGFKTLLVDSGDLAGATSAASSKMLHGGLRYLANGQLGIAYESAAERRLVLQYIAPHLAHPAQWIVPKDGTQSHLMTTVNATGVVLGDLLRISTRTPSTLLHPPRIIGKKNTLKLAPALQAANVKWAIRYQDAVLSDDARFVMYLARTAKACGAGILTRTKAKIKGEHSAVLTDQISGQTLEIFPHVIINAAGVWAGQLDKRLHLTPSRGSHIVVKAQSLLNPKAIFTTPVSGSFGRFLFAIPGPDSLVYIGLTDEPDQYIDGHMPNTPQKDIDFILHEFNKCLSHPLTQQDIVGTFTGLRPLIYSSDSSSTSELSRKHVLIDQPGSPITIAGGKFTTYRAMAQDAVNCAARRLEQIKKIDHKIPCRTKELPLVGAASKTKLNALATSNYRRYNYGTNAIELEKLCQHFPQLDRPVTEDSVVTKIELLYGAICEGALSVEDLLARRTRLWLDKNRRKEAIPIAEEILELSKEILNR